MENRLCFVQFLHPGGEAPVPPSGEVAWNVGDHYRKFLRAQGDFVESIEGKPVARGVELGFWGEWEAQTKASPVSARVAEGPNWIHEPYYDLAVAGWRQNTDPFVFGEQFQYTGCRQHVKPRNATWKVPTQLARLDPGSVVVFGSARKQHFIIDTVFVAGDRMIDHNADNYERKLDDSISPEYRAVTIDSWYSGLLPASQTHRLYFGATPEHHIDWMFSFFPCAPLEERPNGFSRPRIEMDQVTQNKAMGFKRTFLASRGHAVTLWQRVAEQVLDAGFKLGVRAELPPRRGATATARRSAQPPNERHPEAAQALASRADC